MCELKCIDVDAEIGCSSVRIKPSDYLSRDQLLFYDYFYCSLQHKAAELWLGCFPLCSGLVSLGLFVLQGALPGRSGGQMLNRSSELLLLKSREQRGAQRCQTLTGIYVGLLVLSLSKHVT